MQDIFVKRLEALMEEYNMSQIELANQIGTTNVTISRYLSSNRVPRLEIIAKIAEVFHTSVDYLVGLSNYRNGSAELSEIQQKLDSLGLYHLSATQITLITQLLEKNKDIIRNSSIDKNSIA